MAAFILGILKGPFELLCVVGSFVTGYVRHIQYRTDNRRQIDNVQSYDALERSVDLEQYAHDQRHLHIERYEEFVISHIEIDDQGQYWDKSQLQTLEDEVLPPNGQLNPECGVVMVCFVHGWNNNASYWNGNLRSFRAVLSDLHQTEQNLAQQLGHPPRRIVGIYISWRGLAHRWPLVKFLTFWNRKHTSHKVGRGDLVDALSRIEQIRFHTPFDKKLSRFIIIGHSFGGAAVYSAVAPYIKTVAVGEDQAHRVERSPQVAKIRGFGDLVVLVNPAFEALLYDGINELIKDIDHFDPIQHVVMMTVGADNDGPTRLAFPLGQVLGRFHERNRSLKQAGKILQTTANYEPFVTKQLSPSADADMRLNQQCGVGKGSISQWQPHPPVAPPGEWTKYLPNDRNWKLVSKGARRIPDHCPFMTIRAKDGIVNNHSGIFLTFFVEFLRDFVIAYDLHVVNEKTRLRLEDIDRRKKAHQLRMAARAAGTPVPQVATQTRKISGYQKKSSSN